MMNILVIGLNYAPEPIGIGPYTAQLCEFLAARGHKVEVIAGNPYYPEWRRNARYPATGSVSVEAGVTVRRVPHYIPRNPSGFHRIAHYLSFRRSARKAIKHCAMPDLVLTIAPSLLAAPVALAAARRWGVPAWLHIQDFEVDAALETGLLPRVVRGAARRFERRTIAAFDHVSSIGPAMVRRAIKKGASPDSAVELRNWAEIGSPDPARVEALRRELDLPGGKMALYSGNLARKQGCGLFADAARHLSGRDDVTLLVCGDGPERAALEQAASNRPNLLVRPLQPRERLSELLALADVHLLPQIAGAADLVLPSKLANMLASGRPVIAGAETGTGLADEVEGCGLVVQPGDAQAFSEAIVALCDDDDVRAAHGQAARQRAAERWSRSMLLERFADALERCVAGEGEK